PDIPAAPDRTFHDARIDLASCKRTVDLWIAACLLSAHPSGRGGAALVSTDRAGEIVVSPNHVVFDLPEIVAIQEGLFEAVGLRVRFADEGDRSADSRRNPAARHKETLFATARADVYNVCEWGGIDRLERDTRGGRIGHLRAAVVSQALVSLDDDLNEPHHLADVPVPINEYTGSHYTALHLLEGTVPRERIRLEHTGPPTNRLDLLLAGESRATMLM